MPADTPAAAAIPAGDTPAATTAAPATGGSSISADTNSAGGSGVYTTLVGPSVTEGAAGDLGVGSDLDAGLARIGADLGMQLAGHRAQLAHVAHHEDLAAVLLREGEAVCAFPEAGISKRDLAQFYEAIADRVLPYLRDRPLERRALRQRDERVVGITAAMNTGTGSPLG